MTAPVLLLSIPTLARFACWADVKRSLRVQVTVNACTWTVHLVARPTRLGKLYSLLCPVCGSQRRDLYLHQQLGCRGCLRLPYRSALKTGLWSRNVMLPGLRLAKIEKNIATTGMDRNTRHRLVRKRARLVTLVKQGLADRLQKLKMEIDEVKSAVDLFSASTLIS